MTPEYSVWRPMFAKELDPLRYNLEWLDEEVATGRIMFECSDDAAILFEIKEYPTGATDLNGLLAAGKLADIVEILIPACIVYGRSVGCLEALIESREGWSKVLRGKGFEPHQLRLRKKL